MLKYITVGLGKVVNKSKEALNNEKGWGLVETLIVGAIIILGLIALKTPMADLLIATFNSFKTFLEGRLTTLFT